MSECVVRMEMPKCCEDCAAEYDCMACGITGTPWYESEEFNPSNGRLPDCPIICQLPEGHGRLIDASYVIDVIQDELDNDVPITVDDCFQIGCKIPTIVPADTERSET